MVGAGAAQEAAARTAYESSRSAAALAPCRRRPSASPASRRRRWAGTAPARGGRCASARGAGRRAGGRGDVGCTALQAARPCSREPRACALAGPPPPPHLLGGHLGRQLRVLRQADQALVAGQLLQRAGRQVAPCAVEEEKRARVGAGRPARSAVAPRRPPQQEERRAAACGWLAPSPRSPAGRAARRRALPAHPPAGMRSGSSFSAGHQTLAAGSQAHTRSPGGADWMGG